MKYTILSERGEYYILHYPAGNNGVAVNITTALTAEACERVRAEARGRVFFDMELGGAK